MKKIIYIISLLGLLLVSCEKEASAGDFLNGDQIEKLKIISRGVKDPNTGQLIDPITGGIINPDTGVITDPETGLEIDPNTGEPIGSDGGGTPAPIDEIFAMSGDLIGTLDGDDFNMRSATALLNGNLLTISFINENGNSITLAVNNPKTQPFGVNSAENFTGSIDKGGDVFSTDFSSDATGFLQLVYDGDTVSGSFEFKAFFRDASGVETTETSEVTGGGFGKIEVTFL
ncbi:hypothetical protein [Aquimarina agarilytica]|uniref:hypothetical protein n=1 Tax=Aquimarina agarilytica TaxID=1087449 RepID=UPI00028A3DF3|nr:hypothetical protein [Aquimarina agarilytica]